MSRPSKFRFPFWKKAAQRSFRKLLRPLFLERLEDRQLFDATNWTNPLQRLDVSGDVSQSVDPLDALIIINEINAPFYTSVNDKRLPDLPDSNRDPHPFLDVDCDGFVSPLDVLNVVNAINQNSFPKGWDFESNSNSIDRGFVSSASCGPKIHEGSSYVTQISTEVLIPPNATNLSFRISSTFFDAFSAGGMKDAFEASFVDQKGQTLVFPYVRSRDSFLNMSEGQVVASAPGVSVSGDRIQVNVSQIPAGTVGKLIVRLVNNDHDSRTSAAVSDLNVATVGTPVPISSTSSPTSPSANSDSAIDFAHFTDVTGSLVAQYGRTSHFADPQILYTDLSILNGGTYESKAPMLLVLKNFSDPSIRVRNADGLTPEGFPYFDYSTVVTGGTLAPGGISGSRNVSFYNPNLTQFTYDTAVLGQLNRAPTFTSEPDVEALSGKTYSYTAKATDPDADKLKYSILIGPVGMTIDSASGIVIWNPTSNDLGNQSVTLRADDAHGAHVDQSFTLAVSDPPPNRPPVFTSRPIVDSNLGQPYVYDATARDDDGDGLTFRLVSGPQTMEVNAESGRVTWTPTSDQLVYDPAKDFSATVNPGNPWSYGWTASQGSAFNAYPRAFHNSGLDAWDDANQFVVGAPVVTHNGTSGTILAANNIQWAPGQLSFHPGPSGQRSVVRWTAPVGGDIRIDAEFGNLDLNRAATTDVHVLHNNVSVFDGIVQQNNKVRLAPVQRQVKVGDTIDFVVGEGANGWTYDTTSLAANIVLERQTSVGATLIAQDGRGGSATQSFVIDIQPTLGNQDPAIVSTPNVSKIDLIRNGSFELTTPNDVVAGCNGCQAYIAGIHNNSIANWTLEGSGEVFIHKSPDVGNAIRSTFNSARTGNQYLDLSGGSGDGAFGRHATIYQTFATIPSTKYELRFFIGAAFTPAASINVRVDGASSIVNETFTANAPSSNINWTEKVITFVADSTTTKLSFRDTTGFNDDFSFVDDVSVTVESVVAYAGAPSFSYDVDALDADKDVLSYFLAEGPSQMTINSQTGRLEWSPGTADVGEHIVVVRVQDGKGGMDIQKFAIHVTAAGGAEIRGKTLLEPPVPALPKVSTTLTVDNRYALFYGAANGSTLNFVGQDDDEFYWPETFSFNPGQGDYIYVVAWDYGAANFLVGDFLINDTQRVLTNSTDWEYVIGKGVNPGTSYDPPPLSTLQSDIASGRWKTTQVSSAPFDTFDPPISSQAQFIWADTFDGNVSASAQSYVIFRIKTPVPAVQPGLPNFTVYLDQNNNDQRDPGERFTTTDAQGNYAFTGLLPAKYTVAQIAQPGWKQTQPASGTSTVNLAAGQIANGFDFSYGLSTVAEIRGTKFHDLNDDGARTSATTTVRANVPGISDPWLAGMPDGSTASSGDVAPAQSPVQIAGLTIIPGTSVTFRSTGSVNYSPGPSGNPPDGDLGFFFAHGSGAENGISNVNAPANSLIAVFLGSNQPSLSPAPTVLDFSGAGNVVGGIEYRTLFPNLKQVFFVGDGITSDGVSQQIIVPEGATRLFLGTMDGFGWFNNSGAFDVAVTASKTEPGLRGWTIYLDQNSNALRDPNEPSTVTDSKGEYAFTNLAPGTYVVAEESYPTYDAVRDFTTDANPNSPWTYGFSQTRGSTFQQSTISGVTTTLDYWSATTSGPHITHNLTGSTIPGGITYPPDALNLDPSFDGRNSVLRFTAPVTDTYRITGRFQGIDLTRGSTTDVAILQNSNSILTGNINGFFTDLATTPGAIVPYDLQLTLQQGETLDFSVGQGTGGSLFDSTGVSAIIVGKNWRQTAPLTKTHPISVFDGEVRKNVDFGNLELAAQPPKNHSPKITSTAVTESGVGARYVVTATATDIDGDRLTFDFPVKPSGMTVDSNTGFIVWTPTADQAGVQNVILRVSDGRGGVDLQSFQVNVASRNSGPTITSRPLGPAQANLPYQYRIRAQDAEGDAIEYSLNTPAIGNMTVDSATGVFSWLPSSSDIGSHTIEVTATDPSGDGQLQKFTLEVLASAPNREPQILSTPRDQVRLGSSYMVAIDAIDPDGDPLAYRLDVAPSGMTIDVNGLITWTPTAVQFGNNPVQVGVSDGRGGVRTQALNLAVLSKAENHAPVINSTPTLAATLGLRYRYDVKATDEDGDTLAFSLDSKPTGMSIDALSGAIRWIPTADQLGAQSIVVRVTDTQGSSVTQSLTVTVRGSNLAPEISSVPKTIAAVGRAYSYVLKATDPEGGPLTYSLPKKSGNMIIDSSGTIQWVPGAGELGNVNVIVRVSDDQGASVEQSFTVVVAAVAPNAPPIITSQPNLGATVGQRYQYQVTATDPDGGPVRFAFLEVPNGMTIDESTGLIQWTSDAAGIGRVTVLVGDFDGGEAEQSFEVTVRSSNVAPQITSTPVGNAAAGVTYNYDVRASDANLDPLTFALVSGPVGMTIDNLGRITWTTAIADAGTHRVRFTVSDDLGASAAQEYDLVVTADTEAPRVRIQVDSNPVGLSETLIIQVNASDNTGVKTLDVTVDGKAISLDARGRASVLMTRVGSVRIAAVATDAAGNTGRQTMDVLVVDTSVTGAPTVDVTIPAENATITAPTDVIGTVQDPKLVSWKLEVAPFDGGDFKQIATGTNQIANGKIVTFDPTMLQNDSYILRLTALNTGGLTSSIDTVVNVTGNLKLGNFRLSFTDLSIPVAGIPITVSRTYDTIAANQDGELGFGWKLAFRDVDLRTSLPKTGDEAGGLYTPFRDGTRVYITLPGGQREGFTFRPKAVALFDPYQRERDVPPEYQPGSGLNAAYFVPSFVPDKGVTNTLTVRRYQLTKQGHEYFQFGGGLPYNSLDPNYGQAVITLRSKEGIVYRINGSTGLISSAHDSNGKTLQFTDDSVLSSTGAAIRFERDIKGRIVKLTEPMGSQVQYQFDSVGDLTSVTDRGGNKSQFTYLSTPKHYLDKAIDPLGNLGWRTEYDDHGRLSGVRDVNGQLATTTSDPLHRTETAVDPFGNTTINQLDDRGNVIATVDALGNITHTTYDEEDNPVSVTDPLGNSVKYTYDEDGNRLTSTDPLGNVTRYNYDSNGQLLSTTDPMGATSIATYDTRGNQLTIQDASGASTSMSYDSDGNLLRIKDQFGHTRSYAYDVNGNVTRVTDPLGRIVDSTYDAHGNTLIETEQIGTQSSITSYSYDVSGRIIAQTDAAGGVKRTEYDAYGHVAASTDKLGRRTVYTYDTQGHQVKVTFSDGSVTSAAFNANGRLQSRTDASGRMTRFEYDKLGRLTTTIFPDTTPNDSNDNPKSSTEYDAIGRVRAEVDLNGSRREFTYDAAGRVIATRDPLGNVTSYFYDAAGTKIAETDPLGRTTRFVADDIGRIIKVIYADGRSTQTIYGNGKGDSLEGGGQIAAQIDELGRSTRYDYDATGQLTMITDAAGGHTVYGYDSAGQLTRQQDALGRVTQFEYDLLGRRTAIVLPLGQRSSTVYDAAGNVKSEIGFDGRQIQYEYDSKNRRTSKIIPNGTSATYTYLPSGERFTVSDSRGITTNTYDSAGNLTSIAGPDGMVLSYTYDKNGAVTSMTSAGGTTTTIFDALGRRSSVAAPNGSVTRYSYDAVGNLIHTEFPNSTIELRTYDLRNRLLSVRVTGASGLLTGFRYTLTPSGQRLTSFDEISGQETSYAYDQLGRLVRESISVSSVSIRKIAYTYDAVGNRSQRNDSTEGVTDYFYDENDRLISSSHNGTVTHYGYDANGNLTSEITGATDQKTFHWDAQNHLVAAEVKNSSGTHTLTYVYDADGNRVERTEDGISTRFLIDSNGQLPQVVLEYAPSGVVNTSYTIGNRIIAEGQNGVNTYYLVDGSGSTIARADSAGTVIDRLAYDAFGRLLVGTSPAFGFVGEQIDPTLDWSYLRARYYDTQSGRFVSRDPFDGWLNQPHSLHKYMYAGNDPINRVDPTGLFDWNLGHVVAGTSTVAAIFGAYLYNRSQSIGQFLSTEHKTQLLSYLNQAQEVVSSIGSGLQDAGALRNLFGDVDAYKKSRIQKTWNAVNETLTAGVNTTALVSNSEFARKVVFKQKGIAKSSGAQADTVVDPFTKTATITFYPGFWNLHKEKRGHKEVDALIHELTHAVAGTFDIGYGYSNSHYYALTQTSAAVLNADNYALLAQYYVDKDVFQRRWGPIVGWPWN